MSFNNMGKPIPTERKFDAYAAVKNIGVTNPKIATDLVNNVGKLLEDDNPEEAMRIATDIVDTTGAYRLFATLLT